MNWKKWFRSMLKTLIIFGIVLFVCWLVECVLMKEELDFRLVVLTYLFMDTTIRYYEKEE